ncbi:cytochrome c oxidase assembly protein [Onishia niordana]|uniref:cytochrome c oxidase assembly protein n=1 Tax=Onishia niordana TaxID=2508711 RepID=UPI0010A09B00|nr:cytochrome c oxidase assembly protein [Halomonas niordiana]
MTGVQRTVTRTVVVLLAMFVFAFALVPLYDVFCRITGINGKVENTAQAMVRDSIDESRVITVQFVTRAGAGLPWKLEVLNRQVRVHPGAATEVHFAFTNHGSTAGWGRAVPSVSPSEASLYMRKITCFCFQEQRLAAGERLEAPLVFQLTRDLPDDIKTVTLVYTLYPVDDKPLATKATSVVPGGET